MLLRDYNLLCLLSQARDCDDTFVQIFKNKCLCLLKLIILVAVHRICRELNQVTYQRNPKSNVVRTGCIYTNLYKSLHIPTEATHITRKHVCTYVHMCKYVHTVYSLIFRQSKLEEKNII